MNPPLRTFLGEYKEAGIAFGCGVRLGVAIGYTSAIQEILSSQNYTFALSEKANIDSEGLKDKIGRGIMANIHDVAAYILKVKGPMTTMKLQKLVYYCQAWSLVWEDRPIFESDFQAWANGPVSPELYRYHKGLFSVETWEIGNPENLSDSDTETIDAVLEYYGDKTPQWLSDLTHQEHPWRDARNGLTPGERSSVVITTSAMAEYYGGL